MATFYPAVIARESGRSGKRGPGGRIGRIVQILHAPLSRGIAAFLCQEGPSLYFLFAASTNLLV